MSSGGARVGAGRKASVPGTISVHWRVSERAHQWLKDQSKIQGVSIAKILDELVKSFEERAEQEAYESAFLDEIGM